MPVINNTPPIDAVGEYVLRAPFLTENGAIYTTQAIEGFESLEEGGVNVFEEYYQPLGLDQATFDADRAAAINIITLFSDTAATIHVPSSYIDEFPNSGHVGYSQLVVSLDLGILPDSLELTSFIDDIARRLGNNTGTTVTSNIHLLPITDTVDYTKHQQLETARLTSITFSETIEAENARLLKENESLREQVETLEEALVDLQ